ncbi:MAG: PfkB family carbohydrate kinase [Aggregatilineales bacterium]
MGVVSMGELLIDFVSLEDGVTVGGASGFQKAPGGAPANVAVGVARLGQDSAFLGQVGDDAFGHYLADVMKNENVNIDGLRFSSDARTMLAFVSLGEGGERSFMFYRHPSADMTMRPADVATDVIDNSRILHFGSITMINEPSRSATVSAVKHALNTDKLVSYDPNLRLALWDSEDAARQGMWDGLEYAHIVKISEDEVQFMTGHEDVTPLWREHTQMIFVTYGADGAVLHLKDGTTYEHPGYEVKSVDTTGAGDAFVAGALTTILEQQDAHDGETPYLEEILKIACAAGALTTTGRGAIPSLPTKAEVEVFIQS